MESQHPEQHYDITDHCELCKALDCCPEHCCDWDRCTCSTCRACILRREETRVKKLKELEAAQDGQHHEQKLGHAKSIRILAKNTKQEVKKVNTSRKKESTAKKPKGYMDFESSDEKKKGDSDDEDEEEEEEDDKPHEKIKLKDGACIINYEVELDPEEEEEQVYAGGIKGIRALKKQQREFE